jgi:BASS family bile acid:Na+ symporter
LVRFLAWGGAWLAWLGRQGTWAIAALVFIGIAVPPIDALLKPFVPEAIFVLLCLAFVRIDLAALRGYVGRPGLVLAATGWTMLAVPALFGLATTVAGLEVRSPDLLLALMLQAVASPMMAAPAFAAAMGLDETLVLVTLVAGTALTPVTAPLFAHVFAGSALSLSPLALGLKLFGILAGSALVAGVMRRLVGYAAIERHRDEIGGLNILVLFVFVASVMEHVAARFLASPLWFTGLTAFAFALFFALLGVTTLLFVRIGRRRALALGLTAAQRNMGLMLAATGGALPDFVWLYFAVCQFPIYLSPHLLKQLGGWLERRWELTVASNGGSPAPLAGSRRQ